jgi:hypothetical protein
VIRGDDDVARRNIRATALAVTLINVPVSLHGLVEFRSHASPASSW